ncbi:MAG: ABC transporter substrate-binding protein [Spirochaetaceae bacterium]|jgi:putative ABC transport system substrate-binding protein|nr:ABC transporter substrate-binding protein [Spirochaetaceae bacterium]
MKIKMVGAAALFTLMVGVLLFGTACAKKKNSGLKVGISKIVSHPALDAVESGILDKLNASGRIFEFDLQNANGDVNTAAQIAAQFQNERVDVAVGIATPTAIALANNIKDTPVVFAAITDPLGAGLVDTVEHGKNNVTGVSDAITIISHLKIYKDIVNLKTLGYVYTSSEDNSISSLGDVRSACAELGLELVVQAITNSSELAQAAESIIGRVDGVYITNDNTIFSALPSLIQVCRNAKKPLFSCDVTSVLEGGALIALGWNYYNIGQAAGDVIIQILDGKKPAEIPVRFLDPFTESDFLLDLDEAERCGIKIPERYLNQANRIFQNGKLTEK